MSVRGIFIETQTGGGTAEYFWAVLDGGNSEYINAFFFSNINESSA